MTEEKEPDREPKEGIDKIIDTQLEKKKTKLGPSVSDVEMKSIMESIRKKAAENKAQPKLDQKPMFEFRRPSIADKTEPKIESKPGTIPGLKSDIEVYVIEPHYETRKAEEKMPQQEETDAPDVEQEIKQEVPEELPRIFTVHKDKEDLEKEFAENVKKLDEKQQIKHKREKPEFVPDKVLAKRIWTDYRRFTSIFLVIAVLLVISTFIFIKLPGPDVTGKAIAEPTYLELNRYITGDTVIPMLLESNNSQLSSLMITGRFVGDGRLRIYLESESGKILIADSDKIRTEIEPINATAGLEEVNYVNYVDQDTNSEEIRINLEYSEDSEWDPENDGVEFAQNAIDFTVNNSIVPEDRSLLCTRWIVNDKPDSSVCYGNNECCNFLGLSAMNSSWDAPFYLHAGMQGIGKDNHVKVRILNLDLDNEINTVYTKEASLPARFYDTMYAFADYCEESCNIVPGFTGGYNILIEITGDIYLDLFNVKYTASEIEQKIEELPKDIPAIVLSEEDEWAGDYKLSDNYDRTFDLEISTGERTVKQPGKEIEIISTISAASIRSIGKDQVNTITARIDVPNEEEISTEAFAVQEKFNFSNATLTLRKLGPVNSVLCCEQFDIASFECSDGWKKTGIEFVDNNETISFDVDRFSAYAGGFLEEYEFNPEIRDADGNIVEYDLEISDMLGMIEKSIPIKKQAGFADSSAHKFAVKEGKSNIKIKPVAHPIKSIEFNSFDINSNISEFIKLDDVPEFGKYVEIYAIDPTAVKFKDATVTAVAKGTALYKCKDWNFTEQECYGDWIRVMGIVPGQEYTFILTPEDPAFAEVIEITRAAHLDENKGFVSDIYNDVKEQDNVWSETIPDRHYVRVTFEQDLTNGKDITIYPRTVSGTPRIEVYEENGTAVVAEFDSISDNEYNKEYLTGIEGGQDTFDLKILDGSIEFDHIIDPIVNTTVNFTANGTWTVPAGVTSILVEAWGGGGAGGGSTTNGAGGGGGGGGQYVRKNLTVSAGQNYNIVVAATTTGTNGNGAAGENTTFNGTLVRAVGGGGGTANAGAGGSGSLAGSIGDTIYFGGNGATGTTSGGGGGGGAGTTQAGGNATGTTGGTGGSLLGGTGGTGTTNSAGGAGNTYGGGGGGGERTGGGSAGGAGAAGFLRITYINDTDAPSISIISPANITYGNATILVNISAADVNLDKVWYNWNGTNYTYSIPINITFNDGQNTLHAWANDTYRNTNYTNVSFRVDRTAPSISIISPTNRTYNSNTILVNISATDPSGISSIWYNWNGTNYTYTTPINITFNDGQNTLHAWTNDTVGNRNYTNVSFTIDSIKPATVLNFPPDYYNPTQASINFNWTVIDNFDTNLTCNLTIDNVVNVSNIASLNNTPTNYTVSGFSGGTHYWNVTCNDDAGNSNTSETRRFILDNVKPTVALNSPANNYVTTQRSINFNWTATDNSDTNLSCDLILDNAVNASNIASLNNTPTNYTVTDISDGTHYWNVTCKDDANNANTSETRNFTVDTTPPSVFDVRPVANTSYNISQTIEIAANLTDATAGVDIVIANITLPNSSALLISLNLATGNKYNSSYTIPMLLGQYNVTFIANDTIGNVNRSVTTFFVGIDSVKPMVMLNNPANNYKTCVREINFNWTATDNYDTSLACNLTIDGAVNVSNIASLNNTPTNYTVSGLADGTHYWNVTCIDDSGNFNTSETRNFTIDATAPSVVSIMPANASVDGDGTVYFNCSATDSYGISNISLYLNGALNQTTSAGNATYYSANFTISSMANGNYTWYCKAYDSCTNFNTSGNRTFEVNRNALPNSSNYAGDTTIWATLSDLSNVCNGTAVIDDPPDGRVRWWNCVDVRDQNFNVNTNISNNFIEVIFGLNPTFNTSAELVFRNLTWDAPPILLKDGIICNETYCSNASYNATTGVAIFNITGFTNYTTVGNSQLQIWDQTDPDKNNLTKYPNEQVRFYANYTRKNNGQPFLGATCAINFTDSSATMTYNATSLMYEYNRSFPTDGIKYYNVTCSGGGGQTITLSDFANISFKDVMPPNIILYFPADNYSTQQNSINFNWTAIDYDTNLTCNLTIDSAVNASNIATLNNTPTNYTVYGFADGVHYWNITCIDDNNNTNTSQTRRFYVDATKPNIALNYPPNNFNSSIRSINFNWTAIDGIDTNMTCNLTINSTVNVSNIASLNNTPTNYTVAGFSDGTRYWNVTCNDDAGNFNTSGTRNFTVDATPPSVSDVRPVQGASYNISTTIEIAANVTDALAGVSNVSVNITLPNSSTVRIYLAPAVGVKYNVSYVIPMLAGQYNLTFFANDTFGNLNNTVTTFFYGVEGIKPAVAINYPPEGFNSSSRSINFNWTATDNFDTNLSCNLTIDNAVNASDILSGNNTPTNYTVAGLADGTHYWNVTCIDDSGNFNTSETRRFRVDATQPAVSLNFPTVNYSAQQNSINFNWTATNGIDTNLSCNLTINGIVNTSNIASLNSTPTNYTVYGFNDGVYYWNVTCIDDFNNANTSETRRFTIDTTKPSIKLNFPAANYTTNQTSINFNWTATNGIDTNLSCNLTINNIVNASNIASLNNTPTNYTVAGFSDGTRYWNVTCNDDAGNFNTSETRNFTVDATPPSVFDVRPVQGASYNISTTIEIAANVTDALAGVSNVSVNITLPNSSTVRIYLAPAVGAKYNASYTIPMLTGQYNVTFFANDTFGNLNNTVATFFYGVEGVKPAVVLNYPPEGFNSSSSTINFNWTATDNFDTNLSCNLTIDNIVNASNINSPNGTATNYTVAGLADGTHYWNVTCIDDSGNFNTSITRRFMIDTTPPTITLTGCTPDPANARDTVTCSAGITDNIQIDTRSANVTLPNGTNTAQALSCAGTLSSLSCSFNFNQTVIPGIYNVTWFANDTVNNSATKRGNFTVPDRNPVVSLNNPSANYVTTDLLFNITFNCSATDDFGLTNISLFITNKSNDGFSLNQTTNLSGLANSTSWTLELASGTYTWNCLAYDTGNNSDWGDQNRTISNVTLAPITPSEIGPSGPGGGGEGWDPRFASSKGIWDVYEPGKPAPEAPEQPEEPEIELPQIVEALEKIKLEAPREERPREYIVTGQTLYADMIFVMLSWMLVGAIIMLIIYTEIKMARYRKKMKKPRL